MKKITVSLIIFVFVSLSISSFVFAEYDTRQLPWKLPEKPENYKDSHKYILVFENVYRGGTYRDVYLYYCHIPFSFTKRSTSYLSYEYKQNETLVYKLVNGVFVYQNTSDGRIYFEGYYQDYVDGQLKNIWLDYDEWIINRERLSGATYPIASNVNITFGNGVWDKSNGLYDLPHPDALDDDDDDSSIVGGIVGGILNGLKSLFIPERNIFVDIVNKFSDKFPIVGQVVDLFSNLYNVGENEPVFAFTYKDIELKLIDFTSFKDYLPLIRNFTGAFLFLSFITREIKILPGIIRGRQ